MIAKHNRLSSYFKKENNTKLVSTALSFVVMKGNFCLIDDYGDNKNGLKNLIQ